MKQSKITQITKTRVRDWPNGRVYYISLKLENGEDITLWKKKEDAFKVGQDIKYEEIEKGKKWKEVKENWFKTSNPKKDIVLTAFQVAFSNERLARSYKDCLNLVDKLIPEMEARINWEARDLRRQGYCLQDIADMLWKKLSTIGKQCKDIKVWYAPIGSVRLGY